MMAVYQVKIGNNQYRIEISEDRLLINGEEVEADLFELNDAGLFLLNHGEEKLELHLASEGNNTFVISADGQQIETQIETEPGRNQTKKQVSTTNEVIAPIPGVVLEVHVSVGDSVEEGQVACILESMKMQMLIKFPKGGIVAEINVSPTQNVAKGDALILLE